MLEKKRDYLVEENARLNKLAFDLGIKLYAIQRILKSMFFGTSTYGMGEHQPCQK